MRRVLRGAILGTIAAVSIACGSAPVSEPPADGGGRFPITGTILGRRDQSTVTLAHDAIKGYMPAMVMDVSGNDLSDVRTGDRIRATLVVTADHTRLVDVTVATPGDGAAESATTEPAAAGMLVPDIRLTNQADKPIRIRDYRGRVLVVTFIYTRCPLPEFCPRLMANLQDLRRALAARPDLRRKVSMLAVTIDPDHDTTEVLRAYGEARLGRTAPFDRLDLATGASHDVQKLATFFGLRYEPSAGQISHTMVTALVGPNGRLTKRYPELTWTLADALMLIEREAARADPL